MRFPQIQKPIASLTRWQRRLFEAALIIAVIFGVQQWQTRGLPEGVAPPLEGVRTDGSQVIVAKGTPIAGAGTLHAPATLVAFWSAWCPVCKAEEGNIDLPALVDADGRHASNWRVPGVPTHFVVDATGNVRFRVVGYAMTWGLKARLWWAETFPA